MHHLLITVYLLKPLWRPLSAPTLKIMHLVPYSLFLYIYQNADLTVYLSWPNSEEVVSSFIFWNVSRSLSSDTPLGLISLGCSTSGSWSAFLPLPYWPSSSLSCTSISLFSYLFSHPPISSPLIKTASLYLPICACVCMLVGAHQASIN